MANDQPGDPRLDRRTERLLLADTPPAAPLGQRRPPAAAVALHPAAHHPVVDPEGLGHRDLAPALLDDEPHAPHTQRLLGVLRQQARINRRTSHDPTPIRTRLSLVVIALFHSKLSDTHSELSGDRFVESDCAALKRLP